MHVENRISNSKKRRNPRSYYEMECLNSFQVIQCLINNINLLIYVIGIKLYICK